MNLSRTCKHFCFVCLFIPVLLTNSFGQFTENEPTEEPEESNIASDNTADSKINEGSSERHSQETARALFHSSGETWKTASKLLGRGIRMFRESLLEGAKVAHMFKEDLDEGVTSIMRQNRGVKVDSQAQEESSGLSSFFDSQMLREGVLGGILRFMGINSKQMGVIALNVLIIVAEWITSSMVGGSNDMAGATSRMIKTNLLEWASTGHNPQLEKILSSAKSHTLPEKLIDSLSDTTGNATSCVQLLICKMTPVIHGLQDTMTEEFKFPSLNKDPGWRTAPKPVANTTFNDDDGEEDASEPRGFLATSQFLVDKLLGRLPPKDRMLDFGDRCEKKFPQCQLLTFTTTH